MDISRRNALTLIPAAAALATAPALAMGKDARLLTPALHEIVTSAELCALFFQIAHSDFEHTGYFATDDEARRRLYDAWAWSAGRCARSAGSHVDTALGRIAGNAP